MPQTESLNEPPNAFLSSFVFHERLRRVHTARTTDLQVLTQEFERRRETARRGTGAFRFYSKLITIMRQLNMRLTNIVNNIPYPDNVNFRRTDEHIYITNDPSDSYNTLTESSSSIRLRNFSDIATAESVPEPTSRVDASTWWAFNGQKVSLSLVRRREYVTLFIATTRGSYRKDLVRIFNPHNTGLVLYRLSINHRDTTHGLSLSQRADHVIIAERKT